MSLSERVTRLEKAAKAMGAGAVPYVGHINCVRAADDDEGRPPGVYRKSLGIDLVYEGGDGEAPDPAVIEELCRGQEHPPLVIIPGLRHVPPPSELPWDLAPPSGPDDLAPGGD